MKWIGFRMQLHDQGIRARIGRSRQDSQIDGSTSSAFYKLLLHELGAFTMQSSVLCCEHQYSLFPDRVCV